MAASRWRRLVVRPLVWLLAAAALLAFGLKLFLASDFARERARELAVGRLTEALGRRVAIERVEFTLLPSTLIVHGLTVAGDRPGAAPLLTLKRGEVAAELDELASAILTLRRVELEGLDLALEFRADGSDNLPRLRGGGGRGLRVVIGGLEIADSRLRLDHQVVPLALSASAVQAHLVGAGARGLDGSVVAQAVSLTLPRAQPLELAVAARVRLEGDRLEVRRARATGRDLLVAADGEVKLTAGGAVRLDATLTTRGELLDRLGWLHGEVAGPVEFAGEVKWQPGDWQVAGRLTSPRVEVIDFALEELAGDLLVGAEGARLQLESARWAEGAIGGSFDVRFAPRYPSSLALELDGADLDALLARFEAPLGGLRGRLGGPFRYDFDLLDAARGAGRGDFVIVPEASDGATVDSSGEVGVTLADGRVTLDPLLWSAAGQRVEGRGEITLASQEGRFDLTVASEDVGALAALLPFLTPGELWLPTAGTGELAVGLAFARDGYAVDVELAAAALAAPGFAADRAVGRLRVEPSRLTISRLELERGAARLRLAGRVGLAPREPLDLVIELDGWPFADAAPWLPAALPLAGPVRGRVALRGTVAALEGDADVVLAPVTVAGIAARRLAARLDWDAERLRVAAARVDFEAGGVEGAGTLRFADEALDFTLASPALALGRPPLAWSQPASLAGTLELAARIGGTLAAPQVELTGSASGAQMAGAELAGGGPLAVSARWRDGRVDVDLDLGADLRLTGGGELAAGRDARLDFRLDSGRLDRLVALATGVTVADLTGTLVAEIGVDWPAGAGPRAGIRVPALEFDWRGRRLRALEPIVARVDAEGATIDSVFLGSATSADDELFVGGRIAFGDDSRLDLHVQLALGAEWVEPFLGDLDVSGRLDLLADVRGSVAAPEWNGQAGWTQGRVLPPVLPHTLERGRALLLIYPSSVVLDRLSGELAGGTLEASGRLQLRSGKIGAYRFEAAGRRLALRWPSGWQLRGDLDLTLQSTAAGRQIGGLVELDRAFYFQDIDLSPAELVQRLLARSPVLVPETDELLASTALDVALHAPGALRIRNNVANFGGSAELALRGSLARPVVFGDVVIDDDGTVSYGGSTYRIDRGVLSFANPTRIDPLLDVVASTRVQEYDVRLQLSGPLSRPITSFSSDPPLPDLEILGLISTGAPVESGLLTDVQPAGPEGSASVAAEALLYGQAASLVGARVGRLFGFDRIRVEPLSSDDAVSTARVTVGKRISSRLFVTYSYDPSSTAQDIIQVEWRLSDRMQLVLTQNGDESYAVDARWEKRF